MVEDSSTLPLGRTRKVPLDLPVSMSREPSLLREERGGDFKIRYIIVQVNGTNNHSMPSLYGMKGAQTSPQQAMLKMNT